MDLSSFLTFLGERTFFVSITILVLLAIRPLAKKLPRKGMYFLWVILVLRILCPVNFTGIYHLLPAANATNAQIKQELSFGGAMNQYRLSPVQQKRFQNKQQTKPSVLTHSLPEKQPEEIRDFSLSDKLPAFLFILWLSGVFVCVFHLFYSYYRDKKMLKTAVKTKNCCYIHSGLDTPFVFGFFKPRIYIPENTENSAYKFLLAHEKYHIRRQDFRIKPIAFFAFSLLWFNPLGWVAWHLMQKDMEISCDEAVIKQMPFEERKAYSHLLLQMAAAKSRPLCTNAAFGADIIEERILHIMKFKKPTKLIACFTVIAVFLCACGVGSTPVTKEESSTNAPSQKSPDVFVENAINCPQMDDSNYVYYYSRLMLNPKKNLVWLGSKYNKNSYEFVSYMMFEKKENSFEEVETNWSDILNKTMKNRSGYIYDSWYASDESLYVVIMETSMNPLIYNANQEKYKKQYEELNPLLFHISKDGKTAREIDLSALASPNGEKNKDLAVAFIPLSDGRYLVNSLSDDTPEKGLVFAESTDTVVKKCRIVSGAMQFPQFRPEMIFSVMLPIKEMRTLSPWKCRITTERINTLSIVRQPVIMALHPMQIAILHLVYGRMKFFLFQKKEYFVLNMATKPLQRLLTSKQITSTTLPWTATRLPNNGHPCGSRGKIPFMSCSVRQRKEKQPITKLDITQKENRHDKGSSKSAPFVFIHYYIGKSKSNYYLCTRPEPSPPASFKTSSMETML